MAYTPSPSRQINYAQQVRDAERDQPKRKDVAYRFSRKREFVRKRNPYA